MAESTSREQALLFRWHAHGLDRAPGSTASVADLPLLDHGVQDTGPRGSRWALTSRGLTGYDEEDVVLAWTWRGAPHAYRRTDAAAVAVAASPYSEKDAAKRVFDAAKPLAAAGIPVLDALATIAREMRDIVDGGDPEGVAKGLVSTELTSRMPEPYLRECRPCTATHLYEQPFRFAALQAGLEIIEDTAPVVLRAIPGVEPSLGRHRGGEAEPRFDAIRGVLRFAGPATPKDVATYLDAPVAVVKEFWPADAVEVRLEGEKAARFVLEEDLPALESPPEGSGALRLLGPYDPWLQARDRGTLVPDTARHKQLWPVLGRPGAVALDGEVLGVWRPRSKGKELTVAITPWEKLGRDHLAAAKAEAGRLAEVRGRELAGIDVD